MKKIYLAAPRGHCAGVHRAISMLDEIIKTYSGEGKIYVNHEIIHNKLIVNYFEKKGVIFSDNLDEIESGNIMVFSAHGVAPSFVKKAKEKGLKCIDASCPLVIKVHMEAKRFIAKGYKIIYIGKAGHQEAIGVKDNNPENIFVISKKSDADKLIFENGQKLALLNQTTLSVDDTKELIDYVKKLFPQIEFPPASDICYATTNRQEAVKEIVEIADALIIVGSQNSSNSTKLKEIGDKKGIKSILIDNYKELSEEFLDGIKNIGISAGASAPESSVNELIEYLKKVGFTFEKEVITKTENTIFPYKINFL